MKKAEVVEDQANRVYKAAITLANEARDRERGRVSTLRSSAKEVCDHSDTKVVHTDSYDYHNNVDTSYDTTICTICNARLS